MTTEQIDHYVRFPSFDLTIGESFIQGVCFTPKGTPLDPNYYMPLNPAPGMHRVWGKTDIVPDGTIKSERYGDEGWLRNEFRDEERV